MGFVERQYRAQLETYEIDPVSLRGEERARFLRDQVLAATEELHEILRESSWKPWHHGRAGYGETTELRWRRQDWIEAIAEEFGDLMCFVANLALAHDLTTQDVMNGFERKVRENEVRHRNGGLG